MTTHDVEIAATLTVILCSVVTVYVSECKSYIFISFILRIFSIFHRLQFLWLRWATAQANLEAVPCLSKALEHSIIAIIFVYDNDVPTYDWHIIAFWTLGALRFAAFHVYSDLNCCFIQLNTSFIALCNEQLYIFTPFSKRSSDAIWNYISMIAWLWNAFKYFLLLNCLNWKKDIRKSFLWVDG